MTLHPYSLLMIAGIAISLIFWMRLAREDSRRLFIYLSALAGAFFGANVAYIAADGWLHFGEPDMWLQLATGKTILGALLGGYLTVEVAKHALGYRRTTGDWFAIIAPLGITLGRIGCLVHGCCAGRVCNASWLAFKGGNGIARWPAVPGEIAFNALALIAVLTLRKWKILPGQHFHLYLIGYGVFRFFHEFARDTPRLFGSWSGYQFGALAVAGFGAARFWARAHSAAGSAASVGAEG